MLNFDAYRRSVLAIVDDSRNLNALAKFVEYIGEQFLVAAGKAANLVGERPMPSIARFGRLAYPMRGEVTNRAVLGRKRHSRSDSRSGLSAVGTIRVAANSEA